MKTRLGFTIAALTLLLAFGSGCATPAQPAAMVPTSATVARKYNGAVVLSTQGGMETNPMMMSDISNGDFTTAVVTSLDKFGLFTSVLRTGAGDYRLDVRLLKLNRPMMGLDLNVSMETYWKLTRASDGKVLFDESVHSSYTATFGDAAAAIVRLRIANEGASRENIKSAIERLSRISP